MKEFTEEEIISYADKLLIGLSSEESLSIKEEFKFIDKNIDKINEIPNLASIKPATSPFDLYEGTLREDVAEESVDIDDLLRNTGEVDGREVKVPKVVEQ